MGRTWLEQGSDHGTIGAMPYVMVPVPEDHVLDVMRYVTKLGPGRAEELSRMLAGLAGSESAVSHAEELLEEADRLRAEAAALGRAGAVS